MTEKRQPRHAYIILAHNEPLLFARLVEMLDDSRNDLYVHIDAKSDMELFNKVKVRKAGLVWLPRIRVYWGGGSQITAEWNAFHLVHAIGGYSRYHLLSGVDLPLKSQDYIHDCCDIEFSGKELVDIDEAADDYMPFLDFWRYYHILEDYGRIPNEALRRPITLVQRMAIGTQRLLRFQRRPDFVIKKGHNWVSLTHEFMTWMLENGEPIYRFLLHAHCPDEMLVQTILWNSPFRNRVLLSETGRAICMREIDWLRGTPYVWQMSDFEHLRSSKCLFARKFSSGDISIVDAICSAIS